MLSLPREVSVFSVVDVVLDVDVAVADDSVVVDEVFEEASVVVVVLDAVVDDSLLVSSVVVDEVFDEASVVVVVLDAVSPSDLFVLRRAFSLDARASKDHFWYT